MRISTMNRRRWRVLQNPGDSEQRLKVALADKFFKQAIINGGSILSPLCAAYCWVKLGTLIFAAKAGKHLFAWLCRQKWKPSKRNKSTPFFLLKPSLPHQQHESSSFTASVSPLPYGSSVNLFFYLRADWLDLDFTALLQYFKQGVQQG